jgi:hypothetical protein
MTSFQTLWCAGINKTCMRGNLAFFFLCLSCRIGLGGSAVGKSRYTIGGWIPGTNATFLKAWTPIFVDYLSQEIESKYSMQIRFDVISVDYDVDNSSPNLARAGKLDFICKSWNECG